MGGFERQLITPSDFRTLHHPLGGFEKHLITPSDFRTLHHPAGGLENEYSALERCTALFTTR
jgi:hypothetical protein